MSTCIDGNSVEVSGLNEDDFVYINVCGMMYETLKRTLERFPSTLLGNEESRKQYFVNCKNAYFFDQNRQCFEAILYYYQSKGLLIRPLDIPLDLFAEEISFFGLGEDALLSLQGREGTIRKMDLPKNHCQRKKVIEKALAKKEIYTKNIGKRNNLPKKHWRRTIWELLEFPDSSLTACFFLVIAISIIVFCVETMPVNNITLQSSLLKRPPALSDHHL